MTRLYRQIYLTIIVSLLLVVLVAGSVWRFGVVNPIAAQTFEVISQITAAALPPAEAPMDMQRTRFQQLARGLNSDLSLFDPQRRLIFAEGGSLPPPSVDQNDGQMYPGASGPVLQVRLPDGRWIVAGFSRTGRHPAVGLVLVLSSIALLVAVSAYPVVRWLTRRLEQLQLGVETFGSGNLGARVEVKGKDEVAQLAASFNQAAARIEALLGSHRRLLANASHELRTPLSRVRLGIEFLRRTADSERMAALERDISELDDLIEEILIASRLDTLEAMETREEIDLLALAAEECARYEQCDLNGTPVLLYGDERLLRRLIRNLLENASRHGLPPVRVEVCEQNGQACLKVCDQGFGISQASLEAVFEPFHREVGPERQVGFGLGLALVRQIARRHGGDASIESPQSGGTCVTVLLAKQPTAGQQHIA